MPFDFGKMGGGSFLGSSDEEVHYALDHGEVGVVLEEGGVEEIFVDLRVQGLSVKMVTGCVVGMTWRVAASAPSSSLLMVLVSPCPAGSTV